MVQLIKNFWYFLFPRIRSKQKLINRVSTLVEVVWTKSTPRLNEKLWQWCWKLIVYYVLEWLSWNIEDAVAGWDKNTLFLLFFPIQVTSTNDWRIEYKAPVNRVSVISQFSITFWHGIYAFSMSNNTKIIQAGIVFFFFFWCLCLQKRRIFISFIIQSLKFIFIFLLPSNIFRDKFKNKICQENGNNWKNSQSIDTERKIPFRSTDSNLQNVFFDAIPLKNIA